MKKIGALFLTLTLSILLIGLASAATCNDSIQNQNETGVDCGGECPNCTATSSTTTTVTTSTSDSSTDSQQDPDKIDEGFDCLEEKAGDCKSLNVQELALTILATPKDETFDDCLDELEDKQASNHWGGVKDTAMAILAMKHAGEDTEKAEDWLLEQEKVPTDLIWYLQQDSNEPAECHLKYDTSDYIINIAENKKIDKNAGTCLTRAQSNFWLKISPNCYDKEFQIECSKDFIATLLYKNRDKPTYYILEGTESAPAFGSIELGVNSKCFGDSSCDYEATAWATIALLETGHNVEEYIPYIIAMADSNRRFLPESFIYAATNYDDYATKLIEAQKLGNYWQADGTAHNRFYDTALAMVAIGRSSAEQVTKARDWLLFSQAANGCWENKVSETAFVLWALAGRAGRSPGTTGGTTYCSTANYFCIPDSECPDSQNVGDSYFCPSLSQTCCTSENLQTCTAYGGRICPSGQVCSGNERRALDTTECCTGQCQEPTSLNECESMFYTCMDSCSEYQDPVAAYACDAGQTCCQSKVGEESSGGISWWIWLLIILIIIVIAAILWVKREQVKLMWFKMKTKFKKDKSGSRPSGPGGPRGPRPGMPPRPGFPPIRRMPMRAPPQPRPGQKSRVRHDPEMSATFKKLRDMSK